MITATGTRKLARKALKGKWGIGFLLLFFNFLILSCFIGITNLIVSPIEDKLLNVLLQVSCKITSILISIPLNYGLIVSFMKMKRLEEINIFDFCKIGFENFTRSLKVYLWTLLKMILPIALIILFIISLFFPQALLYTKMYSGYGISGNYSSYINILILLCLGISLIFLVTGLIVCIIKTLTYIYAINISYDEPEITAKESVQKSKEIMKGNKGNLFVLQISHIGWAILAVLPILLCNLIQNIYLILISIILSRNTNYICKFILRYEPNMFL